MESSLVSDVAILFLGVPVTFFYWVIFGFIFQIKQRQRFQILNSNLSKIDKKWNSQTDSIIDIPTNLTEPSTATPVDSATTESQYLILGFVSCFFSWFGFLFSLIASGAIFFVLSRREKYILSLSVSQRSELPLNIITKEVDNFRSYFNESVEKQNGHQALH